MKSAIHTEVLAACRRTSYQVADGDIDFTLRIVEANTSLAELPRSPGADGCVAVVFAAATDAVARLIRHPWGRPE